MWDGTLGFHPQFDIRHNYDGRVVSSRCQPHFTPKEIVWCTFVLEAERTSVLLNAGGRNRSVENFQGPYWETKTEPSFLLTHCLNQLPHFSLQKY